MTADNPQTRRRWFQFRLRSLFILVAVLAVTLSWLAHERSKVRERNDWLESLKLRGARIDYAQGLPAQTAWLRILLGDDSTADVIGVGIGQDGSDADLVHLAELSQLQSLFLHDTQVTDAGVAHLAGLTQLQRLAFDKSQVTNAGLVHLTGLTRLQELYLYNTRVTDAGLIHLAGLKELQNLELNNTKVTDAGLVHLVGLTKLKYLIFHNTEVTKAGRQKLRQSRPKIDIQPDP